MKLASLLIAPLILASLFLTALPGFGKTEEGSLHLLPMPQTLQLSEGRFRIQPDFKV